MKAIKAVVGFIVLVVFGMTWQSALMLVATFTATWLVLDILWRVFKLPRKISVPGLDHFFARFFKAIDGLFSREEWRWSWFKNLTVIAWMLLYIVPLRASLLDAILWVWFITAGMHFLHYISQCLQVHGWLLFIRWFRKNQLVNVRTGELLVDEVRRGLPSCWLLVKHFWNEQFSVYSKLGIVAVGASGIAHSFGADEFEPWLFAISLLGALAGVVSLILHLRMKAQEQRERNRQSSKLAQNLQKFDPFAIPGETHCGDCNKLLERDNHFFEMTYYVTYPNYQEVRCTACNMKWKK